MKHVPLAENIYWVGKIDNREVPFHRLTLAKGTTYNAYLLSSLKNLQSLIPSIWNLVGNLLNI